MDPREKEHLYEQIIKNFGEVKSRLSENGLDKRQALDPLKKRLESIKPQSMALQDLIRSIAASITDVQQVLAHSPDQAMTTVIRLDGIPDKEDIDIYLQTMLSQIL